MKQKDLMLILVVAVVSAVISLVLSNFMFNRPSSRQQTAEVVEKITDDFQEPSKTHFNANSVDPTRLIRIGDGSNNQPFSDSSQ
jgi:hypothetical protein